MNTKSDIVDRIMFLCKEKQYSINKLSYLAGLSQSTLNNIVNDGSKNTGIVTIKKICDGLEISLFDFFNTEEFKSLEQEME